MADNIQTTTMRNVLLQMAAHIHVWQDDIASNLKPTPESLATAAEEIRGALHLLSIFADEVAQ